MNFLKIFCDSFIDNWNMPAVTSYSTGLRLDYRSLAARIKRVHLLFESLNIPRTPGDTRIAIIGYNSIDWITNYMATITYGAVAVTSQVTYDTRDVLDLLAAVDVDILFIDPELYPTGTDLSYIPSLKMVISMDSQTVLSCRCSEIINPQQSLNDLDIKFVNMYPNGFMASDLKAPVLSPDTPLAIFFTSGTMGLPKPVVLTSDNLEGNVIYGIKAALFPRHTATLTSSSMGNVWGTIFNVIVPLASGAHITVFNDAYNPSSLIKAFRRVKPQRVIMSPRQLRETYALVEQLYYSSHLYRFMKMLPYRKIFIHAGLRRTFNRAMGGRCKEVVIGSTNIGRALKFKLHRVGINFTVSYGQVECGGLICYSPSNSFMPSTVGHPIKSMVKCRLRPLEMQGLPDDIGILEVSGMTVMKGYYNDPDGTAEVFTSDGWLQTRDLATINDRGEVSIVGRLDSIIERNGIAIVPECIEAVLSEIEGVRQCVVVDRDGTLTAVVHPDMEVITRRRIGGGDIDKALEIIRGTANDQMPPVNHIEAIEMSPEPLDITLKGTVARYKYL